MPAAQLLRQPATRLEQLLASGQVTDVEIDASEASFDIVIEITVKYTGYLRRQESEVEGWLERDQRGRIPANFPFDCVPGLSREVVQRLTPGAPRLPSVTPCGFLAHPPQPLPFSGLLLAELHSNHF